MPLLCRKSEVQSLLESAGFSRDNPYYIVQQGKVCHVGSTVVFCDLPSIGRVKVGATVVKGRLSNCITNQNQANSNQLVTQNQAIVVEGLQSRG